MVARAATASSAAVTVAAARAACWVERETIGATKAAGVAAARQEVDTTEEGAGMVATEVTVVEEATAGVMVAMVVEAMVGVARAEEVAVVVTAAATGERGGAKVAMGERAGRVVKAEMRAAASRGWRWRLHVSLVLRIAPKDVPTAQREMHHTHNKTRSRLRHTAHRATLQN